jgi:hypothetical protein
MLLKAAYSIHVLQSNSYYDLDKTYILDCGKCNWIIFFNSANIINDNNFCFLTILYCLFPMTLQPVFELPSSVLNFLNHTQLDTR